VLRDEHEFVNLRDSLRMNRVGQTGMELTATSNGPRKRPFVTFPRSMSSSSYINNGNLGTPSLSRRGQEPFFIRSIVLIWGNRCQPQSDLGGGREKTNPNGSSSKARRWSIGQRRRAVMLFAKPRVDFKFLRPPWIEFHMLFSPYSLTGPERYFWGIKSRMTGFKSLVSSPRAALMEA